MRISYRWRFGVGVLISLVFGLAPTASAAVPLGGGAGIVVDGSHCTLATIGHDRAGDLVGFTAAHCGGPGAAVSPEGTDGSVGTVATADGGLDYSVIRFDPAKVTPTASFAGFAINGIGADADWHQPVCKLGAASGADCRDSKYVPRPGKSDFLIGFPWQPGDDGGPVAINGLLVGLIRDGYVIPGDLLGQPPVPETRLTLFDAILADANAKGGAGAGFSPIRS